MKKILLGVLGVAVLAIAIFAVVLTRDGKLITPTGAGTVETASGTFEAFPLPDYAADFLGDGYKSYLVEVAPGIKMHVLEIGSGFPVYMQHGVPVSGFLYRKVADSLPHDKFRIIMPTLVGLGFSSKVPASQHSVENHISWTHTLLEKLELQKVIFSGHDWGGPLGAGAIARTPDMLAGMVVLNTVLDAPKVPRKVATPLKIVKTPVVGEFFLEGLVSVFGLLPGQQNDPASFPEEVVALYAKPVVDSGNAKGPLAMLRMAVLDPAHPDAAHFRTIEGFLGENIVPTEIVWGVNDPVLGKRLADMQGVLPNAAVVETQAGHFLQEEVPQDIAAAIERVLEQINP